VTGTAGRASTAGTKGVLYRRESRWRGDDYSVVVAVAVAAVVVVVVATAFH